jgi:hypothetical protein
MSKRTTRKKTSAESSRATRVVRAALAFALTIGALAASTGCAVVAPYERGKLAHPTMTAIDLAGPAAQHLRAIDEGAEGGSAGAGSGCGCN